MERNSNCASENAFDSSGAAPSTVLNACQACSVATSVSAKIAAILGTAVSWRTTARGAWPTPAASKNASQAKPGAVVDRVIGLVAVAAFGAGPVRFGDAGLHREDRFGVLLRILPAREFQQLRDVGLVTLALRGEILAQVHLAIAEAEARLAHVQRVAVRIALVVGHAEAEEAAAEVGLLRTHQRGERLLVVRGADRRQLRRDRPGAERLDGLLVHEAGVQGRDLGLVAQVPLT